MLIYCSGTDLKQLADHHLGELKNNPLKNPLSPETFVVQNHGMARWLSLYIAEKRGIAANLKFEFPAERVWALIRAMDPDIPKSLPTDRLPMTWAILHILKNDKDSRLEILQQYAEENNKTRKEMRRWKLAGRIADVFDQYLTYRPEMILNWSKKKYEPQNETERWQAVLWNKLTAHWEKHSGSNYAHQAILLQNVIDALHSQAMDAGKLPERVTVFGVSTMPPVYIKILVKLSKLIDVYFYSLETGMESTNPIVSSLGTTGREYTEMLERFMAEDDIEPRRKDLNSEVTSRDDTLFQTFIKSLEKPINDYESIGYDSTIQVHSCHSARREVEVLYDQLISMFDENESLNPSDILVLLPDLENYAPEIEAIFGTVEKDLPEIPYNLAERNAGVTNPIDLAVEHIIQLIDSRFKVTDVIDLLDSTPLQQKFNFTEDNLKTLERWIDDNNIRWGIDKQSKNALDLPESESFTWKSGLNRMVLGYAMKTEEDKLFNGVYPYREIVKSEDAMLVGRFLNLMELLFEFHNEIQASHSISQWAILLNKWIFKFLPENEEYFRDIQRIRDLFTNLEDHSNLSGLQDKVPYRIIRSYLSDEMGSMKTGDGRSGKGVTFNSMIPMRNIPCRVICVLGLNDSSFPRSRMPVAFDLMQRAPKPGDRSHSNEDRQLFLETLLAAGERVYFSYIGQSNRQDTEFPPSVVLRELIDYLMDSFDFEEKQILSEHPLQAFSTRYFKDNFDNSLFSYSRRNLNIAKSLSAPESINGSFLESELPDPEQEFKRLSINNLIRFFQHPLRYMMQNRFGIYLDQDNILDEDREPFQLQGLEGYHLGQELLDRYLNEAPLKSYKRIASATNLLPEGWPGEQAFYKKTAEVERFGSQLQDILKQERLDRLEVDLEIGGFRITGKMDQVYDNEQVLFRFGSMRPKDLIELWVKHLVFQNIKPDSHPGQSRLFTRGKKQPVEFYRLSNISNSTDILESLLNIYWLGLKKNTFFFPESSYAYAYEICNRNKDAEKGKKAAGNKWQNHYSPYPMEGDDPYNKLVMGRAKPMEHSEFQDISISFWNPFLDVLDEGGN